MFARATPYRWRTPGKRWVSSKWNYASHSPLLRTYRLFRSITKSRMCHISVMISWLLSWSTVKCFKFTLMLAELFLNSTWIIFANGFMRRFELSISGRLKRLCSYESGGVRGSSNYQQTKHNQAMHRMPNPPLRCGFVTGDGQLLFRFSVVGPTGLQFLTGRVPQRDGIPCLACSSTRLRCSSSTASSPLWRCSGVTKRSLLCRCSVLYQRTNRSTYSRASSSEVNPVEGH